MVWEHGRTRGTTLGEMAHSHKLSAVTLSHIGGRITLRLSRKAKELAAEGGSVELAETFEVWFLGRTAVTKPDAPLSSLAHRTGYWHHQIRHKGEGAEYARSSPHGPGETDWEVHAVVSSELARKIDDAIAWIDGNVRDDDPLVRLLIAPAYLLTALWLESDKRDQIVIVNRPESFQHLMTARLYSARDFLESLSQERPAQGMPRRSQQSALPT
jgi:hypothetical protein